jgi:hypothetical protein
MPLTLYWRVDGTALDAVHDYSVGDTTATANQNPSIGPAGAIIGSNGATFGDGLGDRYVLDNGATPFTTTPGVGAMGCWLRLGATPPTNGAGFLEIKNSTEDNDHVRMYLSGTDEINVNLRAVGAGQVDLTTTAADLVALIPYFALFRWNEPANYRRLEVYNANLTLRTAVENAATNYAAPLSALNRAWIGNSAGNAALYSVDNVFIADDHEEPIQSFANIISYLQYGMLLPEPQMSLYNRLRSC